MRLQKDKWQHFCACLAISAVCSVVMAMLGGDFVQCLCCGLLGAMGTAVGKEYGDKNAVGNHWCWWDLAADFCGAAIGALLGSTLTYMI